MRHLGVFSLRHSSVAALAVGIVLAAGLRVAWAASPGMSDAPGMPQPATSPQAAALRSALNVQLMGTILVEGGTSSALLHVDGASRVVREGEEVTDGVRLVHVRSDRVIIEREGIRQEVLLSSGSQGAARIEPAADNVDRGESIDEPAMQPAAMPAGDTDPRAAAVIQERAERAARIGSRTRGLPQQ